MSGFIFLFVFVVAGVKLFEQCKVAITYFSNLLNMTSLRHLSKELVKNCIQNNVNRFKDFELGIQEIHRFPKSKFFGCHTNFEGWLLFPEDPIGLIINYLRIPDEADDLVKDVVKKVLREIMVLPLSLLKTAQNHPMLIELKNGETYNGMLVACDTWMNVHLRDAICTSKDGDRFQKILRSMCVVPQ
uniref:U6 snRNA-associated Sm-like protein LSm4 n=1 Tax=Ditylenchus dipsaci TaxID=166011 RepID=A0A915DGM1_9BILA